MQVTNSPRRRKGREGNVILEFALCILFLSPLFFGAVGVGLQLTSTIQCISVTRDVAHMFTRGVDFTNTTSRQIVWQKLAQGLGMTDSGGNGNVILTQVIYVYAADCTAAGITILSNCTNLNHYVIRYRAIIGNPSTTAVRGSSLGNVTYNTDGSVPNYLTSAAARVLNEGSYASPNASPGTPLTQGLAEYWTEGNFVTPDISFLGFQSTPVTSSKFIFSKT